MDQLEHPWGFWEAETPKILPKMSIFWPFLAKFFARFGILKSTMEPGRAVA